MSTITLPGVHRCITTRMPGQQELTAKDAVTVFASRQSLRFFDADGNSMI